MSFQARRILASVSRSRASSIHQIRSKSASTTAAGRVSSAEQTQQQTIPIANALLAAAAGVATVSAIAAGVEYTTAKSVPSFDPNAQRFDQSTFAGRFSRMLLACDPRLLLYTDEQVRGCQAMLQNHANLTGSTEMDRALWEAKRITEAGEYLLVDEEEITFY